MLRPSLNVLRSATLHPPRRHLFGRSREHVVVEIARKRSVVPISNNVLMAVLEKLPRPEWRKEVRMGLLKLAVGVCVVYAGLLYYETRSKPQFATVQPTRPTMGSNPAPPSKKMDISNPDIPVTFKDVKGCPEAVAEVQQIVEFLKFPEKFHDIGAKLPRGILLTGPPGTGKTLLARAVAGEGGAKFKHYSGSQFEEIFVGVGAARIREAFALAKRSAPSIIFIDEIDAIGGSRQGRGEEHSRTTLNQLLVEMDGFTSADNVIVIAATNTPDSLDHALMRPGRFDRHITIPLPDVKGRSEIIAHYLQKLKSVDPDVDPVVIARGTSGCSGADLYNILNSAAVEAAKSSSKTITMEHIDKTKDKIFMGSEQKSKIMPEDVRRMTAYHEGGHALVALKTAGATPIHKATILPRGNALGMVVQLPKDDQVSITYKELLARLDVCMAGRIAEEIVFGDDQVSTGASSDFRQAKNIASKMVTLYGMSSVGLISTGKIDPRLLSEGMKNQINAEVDRILKDSYSRTKKLLTSNRQQLETLAKALLEYDTLTEQEIKDVLAGKQFKKIGAK